MTQNRGFHLPARPTSIHCRSSVWIVTLIAILVAGPARSQQPAAVDQDHPAKAKQGLALFQQQVRGILVEHCLRCHGGESVKGDFDLSNRVSLMDSGYVERSAADSYLMALVSHAEEPFMPFKEDKLSEEKIAAIGRWIDLGAPYDKPLTDKSAGDKPLEVTESDRQFWSFQPLQDAEPPTLDNDSWSRTPIDRFVLARQRQQNLEPNPTADRRTLIRRAYFDLLGLPPSPEEVVQFVNDPDPEAYDRLIDRLLASQHYGERWARHWMDVARFAESHGYEQDYNRDHAYHYRDFLIQALNQDMPYDQFVRWQLAGDELAPDEPLAWMATGFLGGGPFPTQLTEVEFESARYDELDDMTGTTGVAFLGLSIGCARCHDHKFDPIPTKDYYRLASTFTTAIRSEIELDLEPDRNRQRQEEFVRRRDQLVAELREYEQRELPAALRQWLTETAEFDTPSNEWTTLQVDSIESTGGSQYITQPDGSWLAQSDAPDKDTLTIKATVSGPVAALRLEALTHPSLPKQGPGRAANGNFALGDVKLEFVIDGKKQPATLTAARATHEQNDSSLSVAASIDDDPVSGWAVDAGGIGADQAAVFDLASVIEAGDKSPLTLTLVFQHPNARHSLGRLRLSTSARAGLVPAAGDGAPPAAVVEAIQKVRSGADTSEPAWQVVQDWFAKRQPRWQQLASAVAAHEAAGPQLKMTKVMVTSEGLPHIPHHADGRGFPHFYPETYVLNRGDVHQKAAVAEQGFLQVLMTPDTTVDQWHVAMTGEQPKSSFRRASLSHWLTDADDGAGHLLARVMVNRLWQHHFGRGIVATPNDFGFQGERPTHPELLDWLAADLIRHGWRLKRLHKLIMTSAVYMQNNDYDEQRAGIDRENVLLWRRAPQRLEAEPIRDAMLAISGLLDPTMFGPGTLDEQMRRRSVYFFIKRSQLIPGMMLFDWPEHLVSIGQRSTTTIAPQALMFMNSAEVRRCATALVDRLPAESTRAAIDRAYWLALSRPPSEVELQVAAKFLDTQQAVYGDQTDDARRRALMDLCQAIFSMNEFIYID